MPMKDMATSTAAFVFLRYLPYSAFVLLLLTIMLNNRTLGGTVGISIGQTVYSSVSHSVYLDAIFGRKLWRPLDSTEENT